MEELPEDEKSDERRPDDGEEGAGGKKLKTDDETWSPRPKIARRDNSNDSENEDRAVTAPPEVKEENVDSGISIDKSETEDRKTESLESREPTNSVVEAGPSTSAIAVIFNLKKPFNSRNYRRHWRSHLMGGGGDDSMSDIDSDDMSMEEAASERAQHSEDTPRPIMEDNIRSDTPRSDYVRSENHSTSDDNSSHHSSNSASSSMSTDSELMQHEDSDSEEWTDPETAHDDDNGEYETPSALLKSKPKHGWFIMKELMNRELGLTQRPGRVAKSDALFEQRYYGSLHAVHRLELMYKLERHKGCVNAINFHPEGHLLASGSDDLNVVVWDWATETPRQILKTGHKSNVFQCRFLFLNARSQLNIATCARDGQVRLLQCPPSGTSAVVRRRLMTHARSAHKLHLTAAEPHVVLSCGEDGLVQMADVRSDHPTKLFTVKEKGSPVPLFSIHGHPLEPRELLVAGRNSHVRVYDRRKASKPISTYCPTYFTEMENGPKRRNLKYLNLYVTCAVYNHDGSEILASYNDDDIYLFDTVTDRYEKDVKKEGYTHRYSGHRNNATFKGVAFFGPHSEFIVSGSDCSYIYMWEKKTEAIVQWMPGDEGGVVNCIESHPRCPVMASSGLDKDVKIWVPSNEEDPRYAGLNEVVKENAKAQLRSPFLDGFFPTAYSRFNRHSGDDNPRNLLSGNIDFDGQVCTTF